MYEILTNIESVKNAIEKSITIDEAIKKINCYKLKKRYILIYNINEMIYCKILLGSEIHNNLSDLINKKILNIGVNSKGVGIYFRGKKSNKYLNELADFIPPFNAIDKYNYFINKGGLKCGCFGEYIITEIENRIHKTAKTIDYKDENYKSYEIKTSINIDLNTLNKDNKKSYPTTNNIIKIV